MESVSGSSRFTSGEFEFELWPAKTENLAARSISAALEGKVRLAVAADAEAVKEGEVGGCGGGGVGGFGLWRSGFLARSGEWRSSTACVDGSSSNALKELTVSGAGAAMRPWISSLN